MLFVIVGSGIFVFCLLNDLRLGGGYDFWGQSSEDRFLRKVMGAAGAFVALHVLTRDSLSRERWTNVMMVICGGLIVHLPVFYLLDLPIFKFVTVVLFFCLLAVFVTRGRRFDQNLEWFRR